MRLSFVSLVVAAGLVACRDASAPAGPSVGNSVAFSHSESSDDSGKDHDDGGETGPNWVVRFERLVGNSVTGAAGKIRDQNAIGAPWALTEGDARLSKRGELRVHVEGLVVVSRGTNPLTGFKAILSCQTQGTGNTLVNVNLSTAVVPAGPEGNFDIDETLTGIPAPCYAPIVFVTNAGGSWAAVSSY